MKSVPEAILPKQPPVLRPHKYIEYNSAVPLLEE